MRRGTGGGGGLEEGGDQGREGTRGERGLGGVGLDSIHSTMLIPSCLLCPWLWTGVLSLCLCVCVSGPGLWESLLEERIRLQKFLPLCNRLPKGDKMAAFLEAGSPPLTQSQQMCELITVFIPNWSLK